VTIVDDYWASFEGTVSSLAEYLEVAATLGAYQKATDTRFVWRGVNDASYGLHSPLTRRYVDRYGSPPTERQLRQYERSVLDEAREWGIDWHPTGGRLSALEVLARIQHYGVPSRMIDFTFNPLIALWFAVTGAARRDGRVFAVDISGQLVSRESAITGDPWWWDESPNTNAPWSTQTFIWEPPPLEPRIVRQEGCFLMGGMPSTIPRRNVRLPGGGWRPLTAAEVRDCMSVPFVLINYLQAVAAKSGAPMRGKPPDISAFTIRVRNTARIRRMLEQTLSLSARSLFPDVPGFQQYGSAWR
jgi:hypothetical protein